MSRALPDRSGPPLAGEPRPFAFPPFERHRLDNGLDLLVLPMERVPLVQLELITPAGAWHDPPGRAGLATLTASLVDQGSRRRSAPEIATAVEGLGGHLSTGADWDGAQLALGLLSSHLPEGLALLAEVAMTAVFPAAEVERRRRQRLADLLRRRDQPRVVAAERFQSEVYRGTPYAHSLLGDEESTAAIRRDEIVHFYQSAFTVRGATLLAVGDLDPAELLRQVEDAMGGWDLVTPPPAPEIAPASADGLRVHLVERPHAAQTELRLGHSGVPRSHPDFLRLAVLNALLGGKFTSRINLNLRERHGYTYGANSRFVRRLGPGPFVVSTAVANEVAVAAAGEIVGELERIRSAPVTAEELEETRNYLLGIFPYSVQTQEGLSARLEELGVFGLPDDHFDTLPRRLAAVGRDELLAAARRHLRPAELTIVAVGPAGAMAGAMERFGPVTVHAPDESAAGA